VVIKFKWIGGATWLLSVGNLKIGCDPALCPKDHIQNYKWFTTKRLNDPIYSNKDLDDVDVWLLTHNHEDHFDQWGAEKLKNSKIIAHNSFKKQLSIFEPRNSVTYLGWNDEFRLNIKNYVVKIKAIPAIHGRNRLLSNLIGNGNGYLITLKDMSRTRTIYASGDGVFHEGIKRYIDHPVDSIIVNAGAATIGNGIYSRIFGRITNNSKDMMNMRNRLKPSKMIPVHWGTFTHYNESLSKEMFQFGSKIEVINPGEQINL
jgi:L-ascorbate metabolism protein UlaG (beta-lactamase superfamily)